MLVGSNVRRVAVVGGMRIPFARGHGAYSRAGNQDMYTAVLQALVAKYRLAGERLGDVTGGAVLKHSKDFNLVRECVLSSGLDPQTPGIDMQRACGTVEKLGQLKPAFDRRSGQGTLTAGNSTPLTDGASAVLLASEDWAKARNLPVLAYFTFSKQWAVDYVGGNEGLLMAPAYAVPAMLKDANLTLQDFDFYEIHEAFAAQVLCTLKAWESPEYCKEKLGLDRPLGGIDRSKLNVNGSSVAIGHPFAATGTRIVASLAKQLAESPTAKRGLISVCTAGGMGVVAILEKA